MLLVTTVMMMEVVMLMTMTTMTMTAVVVMNIMTMTHIIYKSPIFRQRWQANFSGRNDSIYCFSWREGGLYTFFI